MSDDKVYVGDVGTVILVDTLSDITSSTVRKILARKPNGIEIEWAAAVDSTTKLSYTTQDGDLDTVGKWMLQAYVELPSGKWYGETAHFTVHERFG